MAQPPTGDTGFPTNWRLATDWEPTKHLMQLPGKKKRLDANGKPIKNGDYFVYDEITTDYMNVQSRMIWFLRDQRELIVRGVATCAYAILTECVSLDPTGGPDKQGWAHFKTYARDVLGNEVTMYGSESHKDFADYAEKAGTKSLGRALVMLGYGTQFAPEMDEDDRVVDSPVTATTAAATQSAPAAQPAPTPQPASAPTPVPHTTNPLGIKAPGQVIGEFKREFDISDPGMLMIRSNFQIGTDASGTKKLADILAQPAGVPAARLLNLCANYKPHAIGMEQITTELTKRTLPQSAKGLALLWGLATGPESRDVLASMESN